MKEKEYKSGFVLLLGETNAGKSTLLNSILGEKVSIVSHKVQTTRLRILGIYTNNEAQIVFIDTPGIFNPKRSFDKEMVNLSYSQIVNADIILFLVDANKGLTEQTKNIIAKIPKNKTNIFVFNKVDLIPKEKLLALVKGIEDLDKFAKVFMISALKKQGLKELLLYLQNNIPTDTWYFDSEQTTNLPEYQQATEITQEQIYAQLHQELPYNICVEHVSWQELDEKIIIYQDIYVSKDSYKGMILGKQGTKIKQIRIKSTKAMVKQFHKNVELHLHIKVNDKWLYIKKT